MAFDEPADLIGKCEATLDTLGPLASLVRHMAAHDAMHAAQIARRLSGRPQ